MGSIYNICLAIPCIIIFPEPTIVVAVIRIYLFVVIGRCLQRYQKDHLIPSGLNLMNLPQAGEGDTEPETIGPVIFPHLWAFGIPLIFSWVPNLHWEFYRNLPTKHVLPECNFSVEGWLCCAHRHHGRLVEHGTKIQRRSVHLLGSRLLLLKTSRWWGTVPLTRDIFCADSPGWDAGKSVYDVPDTVEQTQFHDLGWLSGIGLYPRIA